MLETEAMETAPNNPESNRLNEGLTDEHVADCVVASGYPLQSIVSSVLRKSFSVQQEWSFIDSDTKELRALDILATQELWDWRGGEPQPRVRPQLDLLVECKQSLLPYVFFKSSPNQSAHFPLIAGLSNDAVTLTTDDDPSSWTLPTLLVLSMWDHRFVSAPPVFAANFSKCVRKGPNLELSGTDAFYSLMLPLTKATQHHVRSSRPAQTAWYFDYKITVPVGVLDAPMIAVDVLNDRNVMTLLPWVRVLRHESYDADTKFERSKILAVDIVHKDYFSLYVNDHLVPFAKELGARAKRHADIIADGKGFAPGLRQDSWNNLEDRIKPASPVTIAIRSKLILQRIGMFLTGQKLDK